MASSRIITARNVFVGASIALLGACTNSGSLPCTPDAYGTAGDAVTSTCTQLGTLETSARNIDPNAAQAYENKRAAIEHRAPRIVIPATIANTNAPNGTQMGITDGLQAGQLLEGGIGLKLQSDYNNNAAKQGQSAPTVPQFLPETPATTGQPMSFNILGIKPAFTFG